MTPTALRFGYSGSSVDLQGGNIDAQLIFVVNDPSLNLAKKAADERHIVTVKTVYELDPDSLTPRSISWKTCLWSQALSTTATA